MSLRHLYKDLVKLRCYPDLTLSDGFYPKMTWIIIGDHSTKYVKQILTMTLIKIEHNDTWHCLYVDKDDKEFVIMRCNEIIIHHRYDEVYRLPLMDFNVIIDKLLSNSHMIHDINSAVNILK